MEFSCFGNFVFNATNFMKGIILTLATYMGSRVGHPSLVNKLPFVHHLLTSTISPTSIKFIHFEKFSHVYFSLVYLMGIAFLTCERIFMLPLHLSCAEYKKPLNGKTHNVSYNKNADAINPKLLVSHERTR
jgi:hypothetical protein